MILAIFGPYQFLFSSLIVGIIAFNVFFLLTLRNALKEVDSSRRLVRTSDVWLMFIPLFNFIYAFILIPRVCASVKAQYQHRKLRPKGDFSLSLGVAVGGLIIAGFIPYIGGPLRVASIVLYIIFWVNISGYIARLRDPSEDPPLPVPEEKNVWIKISDSDLLDN